MYSPPWKLKRLIVLQHKITVNFIFFFYYYQHKTILSWQTENFFRNSLFAQILTPFKSVLCNCTFCSNYSLESMWKSFYQLCTSGHLNFPPFFCATLKSFRLWGYREWTVLFKSSNKFSIGLRSGLWPGHSITLTLLFWSHSCTDLALGLGSLSWWKTNLPPSRRCVATCFSFLPEFPCIFLP